jgi:hypothetical protein
MVLLHQSAESESPQKLFVNIRGQIGFRVFMHDVRNRRAYACADVLSTAGCSRGRAQHRLAYLAAFFGPITLIYILLNR